jgi:hypothetical protein
MSQAVMHKQKNKPFVLMPLPKVTIVGLLGNQQTLIQKKLEGRANFNFVDKNRKVNPISSEQDIVVLVASFISHAVFLSAKKTIENTNVKLVVHYGGTDMLVRKLDEILPQSIFS